MGKRVRSAGGWQAIAYTWRKAREVGPSRLWRAMRSKNACKTCALGMGGQLGGMTNEAGHFPEFCKKSLQAMAADMQGRIEPEFFRRYSIPELQAMSSRELEGMGRLVEPAILEPGASNYRAVGWDEALDRFGAAVRLAKPERTFFYASGRSSNEAGFLLQLFARVLGTNHVSNCSFYCHQASGVGLSDSIGSGTATVQLEDLDRCDLLFLIGGNPASNHPRLMSSLVKLRRRGRKVIAVNPIREPGLLRFRVPSDVRSLLLGSEIASIFVQPQIGGDIAFMAGVAKRLFEIGQVDEAFCTAHAEGLDEVRSLVGELEWTDIEAESGVPRARIREVAEAYAGSERTIFAWTMGITHHLHGVQNVQWIANLALLRGMIGKPGAGLLPIRGHSNVQGLGSIGVTPSLSRTATDRLGSIGIEAPDWKGYDTIECLQAAHRGEMDAALCLGGNLFGATPDAAFARESFGRLKSAAYLSTSLNTGHAHGLAETTLILPVLARDEEPDSSTQESMFSYVRLSDGGPRRHVGPLSESEVIARIAERCVAGGPLDWRRLASHEEVRQLIARLVPNFESMASIGETKREFHIPGRVLHQPRFPTQSGKARFRAHSIPEKEPLGDRQVRLTTLRSEGQFNTVVYEEEDLYRGQTRRDVILMNPVDIVRLGLVPDRRVAVLSESGSMPGVIVREFDIAVGCAAMYYPEANALVPAAVDPRSKTPAFKSVVVTIGASSGTLAPEEVANPTKSVHKSSRKLKAC